MTTFKHLGALAAGLLLASPALAADHGEAPGAAADPVADIADFYAWNTGESMVFIVTFAGLGSTTTAPMLDSDVLYGIHIDRDFDQVADANLWVRFGQNGAGDWGVQVTDVPGTSGAVLAPWARSSSPTASSCGRATRTTPSSSTSLASPTPSVPATSRSPALMHSLD